MQLTPKPQPPADNQQYASQVWQALDYQSEPFIKMPNVELSPQSATINWHSFNVTAALSANRGINLTSTLLPSWLHVTVDPLSGVGISIRIGDQSSTPEHLRPSIRQKQLTLNNWTDNLNHFMNYSVIATPIDSWHELAIGAVKNTCTAVVQEAKRPAVFLPPTIIGLALYTMYKINQSAGTKDFCRHMQQIVHCFPPQTLEPLIAEFSKYARYDAQIALAVHVLQEERAAQQKS